MRLRYERKSEIFLPEKNRGFFSMSCKEVNIPEDVCRINFADIKFQRKIDSSIPMFKTCRGEIIVFDLNKDGEVISIELIGEGKHCQE
jgi:hypothetical protein